MSHGLCHEYSYRRGLITHLCNSVFHICTSWTSSQRRTHKIGSCAANLTYYILIHFMEEQYFSHKPNCMDVYVQELIGAYTWLWNMVSSSLCEQGVTMYLLICGGCTLLFSCLETWHLIFGGWGQRSRWMTCQETGQAQGTWWVCCECGQMLLWNISYPHLNTINHVCTHTKQAELPTDKQVVDGLVSAGFRTCMMHLSLYDASFYIFLCMCMCMCMYNCKHICVYMAHRQNGSYAHAHNSRCWFW